MAYPVFQTALLGSLLALAASSDVARHTVPNAVVSALLALGALAQVLDAGWSGFASGALASIVVLALGLPVWIGKRIGGGDLKLAVASAMWVGLARTPTYLLATAVAGGVLAGLCYALAGADSRNAVRANAYALHAPRIGGDVARGTVLVPYGVAIAAGAVFAVCR